MTPIRPLALALLTACSVPLGPTASETPAARVGNWADQDTHGLGTHRVAVDALNVRDADGAIQEVAVLDQQLVLTQASRTEGGIVFLEAVFKGGDLDASSGWVAGTYLRHTQLTVCAPAELRTGDQLEKVLARPAPGETFTVVSGTVRNTGNHRYFEGSVGGRRGFLATSALCSESVPQGVGSAADQVLAAHDQGDTVLWDQTFGRADGASPLENVEDAAAGRPASTSCYGGAPCSQVHLDEDMLEAMVLLRHSYGFRTFVTSIAGASHSAGSLHYAGRAFDIDEIDGVRVTGDTSLTRAFMNACWALGAVEVFGPSNDPVGHADHIHCGF